MPTLDDPLDGRRGMDGLLKETMMANTQASLNADGLAPLSDAKLDQVNGGWFPFIALGVALGIGYCIVDGTLDPKPGPKGDFPIGPKNVG
jgi:hypothetical protein